MTDLDVDQAAEPQEDGCGWVPDETKTAPETEPAPKKRRAPTQNDSPDPDSSNGSNNDPERKTDRARRALIRRAVVRTIEVGALGSDVTIPLAAVLSVGDPTDITALTLACLEADRADREVLRTLTAIVEADDMEAAVLATELAAQRRSFKAAWSLLEALGSPMGASPPAAQARAGLALARVAKGLSVSQRSSLRVLDGLVG